MARSQVSNTLRRLARSLFADDADQSRFIDALIHPMDRPTAVVWTGTRTDPNPFEPLPAESWQPDWVDLVPFEQRPGRHAVHESGEIYCLDASSVFASSVVSAVPHTERVIDLCASPGGKTMLAWRHLGKPAMLCNEVIGKRTGALISNLRRCQVEGSRVSSLDTERLVEQMGPSAELVLVDAPCSGQSLIARGKKSPGCFHPATINMNSNRQRRILSNAVQLLAGGGYLAYMTCTYAIKENERNLEWLLKKNPQLEAVPVPLLAEFQSDYSDQPCYRMWPFNSIGAGAFTVLLRSTADSTGNPDWHWPKTVWEYSAKR